MSFSTGCSSAQPITDKRESHTDKRQDMVVKRIFNGNGDNMQLKPTNAQRKR